MQLRKLPVSVTYALTACGASLAATAAQADTAEGTLQVHVDTRQTADGSNVASRSSFSYSTCPEAKTLNSCKPAAPMRALSADEVKLIRAANSYTDPTSSWGGCNTYSCHVTANPPSDPPSSAGPIYNPGGGGSDPGNGGGGGGGDGGGYSNLHVPDQAEIAHYEKCAKTYGSTAPNPNFQTQYTSLYGFTSYSAYTGAPLDHVTNSTGDDPTKPLPAGGSQWYLIGSSTYYDESPQRTEVYMLAYQSTAEMVKVLAHEWYHQNHDVPGESVAARMANESAAIDAGNNAVAAYNADGGARCVN